MSLNGFYAKANAHIKEKERLMEEEIDQIFGGYEVDELFERIDKKIEEIPKEGEKAVPRGSRETSPSRSSTNDPPVP